MPVFDSNSTEITIRTEAYESAGMSRTKVRDSLALHRNGDGTYTLYIMEGTGSVAYIELLPSELHSLSQWVEDNVPTR